MQRGFFAIFTHHLLLGCPMEPLTETRKLTVTEFRRMEFADDDPYLYELLDGDLVKKNAPAPRHQRIVRDVSFAMHSFVQVKNLGTVLFAPVNVFLDDITSPQPDVIFVSTDRLNLITNDGIMGVPSLVVEVISPSSIYHDRVTKKQLYERFGVPEYWLIDPADAYIEIYSLQNARYELLSAASLIEGELTSGVLSGFFLDLPALFA